MVARKSIFHEMNFNRHDAFADSIKEYAKNNELGLKDFRNFSDDLVRIRDGIKLSGQEYHPLAVCAYNLWKEVYKNFGSHISLDVIKMDVLRSYVGILLKEQKATLNNIDEAFEQEFHDSLKATDRGFGYSDLVFQKAQKLADAANILRTFGEYKGKELEKKVWSMYEGNIGMPQFYK